MTTLKKLDKDIEKETLYAVSNVLPLSNPKSSIFKKMNINNNKELFIEGEIWKDVPNYEDNYQVSNLGRIKTFIRGIKIRTIYPRPDKYVCVHLSNNGVVTTRSVHRVVAEAFIPNPENLPCINHIDENKHNNNVSNLEWCSFRYNNIYSRDKSTTSSKYVGVYITPRSGRWNSRITLDGIKYYLGGFDKEIDAKNAYDQALKCFEFGIIPYVEKKTSSSKYKGLSKVKKNGRWRVKIWNGIKNINVGCFKVELDAHKAYLKAEARIAQGLPPN